MRFAILAIVARLHPVAACMLLQDWPAAIHAANALIALCAFWTAPIAALHLGFGLPLRLPAPSVLVVLASNGSEHVEQHRIDGVKHRVCVVGAVQRVLAAGLSTCGAVGGSAQAGRNGRLIAGAQ